MYAKQKTQTLPCTPGAFPGGLTRTRFYDGMLLTQSHLVREQEYWRMKRKLTNRALGTGVVWGLRLEWDPAKRKFLLSPGYALDCCGNDLIVECPQEIAERTLIDKYDPNVQALLSGNHSAEKLKCPEPESDLPREACLVLKYIECAGDPQPVFEDDCTSNVTHCEYSSVRESVQLCLAPPPPEPEPTPIDNFCKQLERLRQACSDKPDCTLFDMGDALAAEEFPAVVELHNLDQNESVLVRPQAGSETVVVSEAMSAPGAGDRMLVVVKPAPGYVILEGHINAANPVDLAPFGGQLETTGAAFLAADDPSAFSIPALRVASLLTNSTHQRADLGIGISVEDADGDGVAESAFVNVITSGFTVLEVPPTCNDNLAPGLIFRNDPLCTLKTLALTVLCGWFKGLLGDGSDKQVTGKHVAAWYVCALAWRLLFDARLGDRQSAALSDALKKLMEEWCAAFIYPGPHCETDHHGVYLGCVELSDKGSIVSFDPWKHRRYVITGPLLSHWGAQFGLAPVDVVIGRIASWICCLRSTSMAGISRDRLAALIDGLPLDHNGMAIVAGDEASLTQYMTSHHLTWDGTVRQASFAQMSRRVLAALSRDDGGRSGRLTLHRRVYALGDSKLYLLEPASGAVFEQARPEAGSAHAIVRRTETMRPLARVLVRDFATAVAETIELSRLTVVADDEVMTALVREMKAHDVTTVAKYLHVGPERAARIALARLQDNEDAETEREVFVAAEELTVASEEVLDAVIAPFAKIDAAGETVAGEDLVEKANHKAIQSNLKDRIKPRTLTQKKLGEIGQGVAKRA